MTRSVITFDYNEDLSEIVKAFGGTWDKHRKTWEIENSNLPIFRQACIEERHKVEYIVGSEYVNRDFVIPINKLLRDYQREGVARGKSQDQGIGLGYEMGLGKTATAIEIMKETRSELDNILIVTTAINRHTWVEQIKRWWPEYKVENIVLYDSKLKAKLKAGKATIPIISTVLITSYELMDDMLLSEEEIGFSKPSALNSFSYIVFDEGHYLSNARSGRSKSAMTLRSLNRNAKVLVLSGTPARDRMWDIYNLLKVIQPGHWGTWHSFVKRYCIIKPDQYSQWNIAGINDARLPELQARVDKVFHRVTKQEVIDQLPKLSFIPVFIEAPKKTKLKIEDIEDLDAWLLQSGYNNVDYVCDWVEEYCERDEEKRLCVVLYNYEVADKVYAKLLALKDRQVFYANGRMDPEKRIAEIRRSLAGGTDSILIVTMESIKTGINDLKDYSRVLFGQWYWSPETVMQAMARFHRLDSPEPVEIYGLIMKGTRDEKIVETLNSKIKEIDKLVKSGSIEEKMRDGLKDRSIGAAEMVDLWSSLGTTKGGYL